MNPQVGLNNTLNLAFAQIEAMMGNNTFNYDGETFACHMGTQTKTTVLETGGFDETQQIVLAVRKEVFTDGIIPTEDEKITFRGVIYYIDKVDTDATNTVINLALKK